MFVVVVAGAVCLLDLILVVELYVSLCLLRLWS